MAITNTLGSGPGEDRDVEYGCGISCWVYRQQLFPRLHRPQPEANPNPRYAVSQMADRMIADDPSPCTRRAVRPKNRFNPSHPLALSTGITTLRYPKRFPSVPNVRIGYCTIAPARRGLFPRALWTAARRRQGALREWLLRYGAGSGSIRPRRPRALANAAEAPQAGSRRRKPHRRTRQERLRRPRPQAGSRHDQPDPAC